MKTLIIISKKLQYRSIHRLNIVGVLGCITLPIPIWNFPGPYPGKTQIKLSLSLSGENSRWNFSCPYPGKIPGGIFPTPIWEKSQMEMRSALKPSPVWEVMEFANFV